MGEMKTYEVPVAITVAVTVSSADPEEAPRKAIAAISHIALNNDTAIETKIQFLGFAGEPVETNP